MSVLELVSVLVAVAALFGWLSARVLRVPQTIGSMGLTVAGSVALIALGGVLPGLHGWALHAVNQVDFSKLILHGALGLLLFAGAFLLDLDALVRQRLAVSMLALLGTAISTAGVATLAYFALPLVGLRVTWLECALFGALISPTDPIAVLEMLGRAGVSKQIEAQLAGESLFNDGVGAVLFLSLLSISQGQMPSVGHVLLELLVQAGGGLLLGVALALVCSEMMRRVDRYQVEILVTLALALGGYALAERLHVSAPLEAVAAGLALRGFNARHHQHEIAHKDLARFWTLVDEVQNALLFVLLGLEVLAIRFTGVSLLAGGLCVLMVIAVRTGTVATVLAGVRVVDRGFRSSLLALSWGGLRGGLSIALALSVPYGSGRGWILPVTYVVVVFSVLVQGGTLGWAMKSRAA